MDTPLHAIAVPDADPATLKRPEAVAREVLDLIRGLLESSRPASLAEART
jgi:hypothetical protein